MLTKPRVKATVSTIDGNIGVDAYISKGRNPFLDWSPSMGHLPLSLPLASNKVSRSLSSPPVDDRTFTKLVTDNTPDPWHSACKEQELRGWGREISKEGRKEAGQQSVVHINKWTDSCDCVVFLLFEGGTFKAIAHFIILMFPLSLAVVYHLSTTKLRLRNKVDVSVVCVAYVYWE